MENIYEIHVSVKRIATLMEVLVTQQCEHRDRCRMVTLPEGKPGRKPTADRFAEDDLMTIKEAAAYIPASRTKVYEMRKTGVLDTIERNSRQKRLLRTQVEAARIWARNKGKC